LIIVIRIAIVCDGIFDIILLHPSVSAQERLKEARHLHVVDRQSLDAVFMALASAATESLMQIVK
jgi:hypothetical protein